MNLSSFSYCFSEGANSIHPFFLGNVRNCLCFEVPGSTICLAGGGTLSACLNHPETPRLSYNLGVLSGKNTVCRDDMEKE